MPSLTCYRGVGSIDGTAVQHFDDLVDTTGESVTEHGPVEADGFEAKLWILQVHPHDARWAPFLKAGFGDATVPPASSPGALLIVRTRIRRTWQYFAFPFGIRGRHLLRGDAYERGYGLRCALNLIYPRSGRDGSPDRVRGIDRKVRGPRILRSRSQISEASPFEDFGIDQLRDVVDGAVGIPADKRTWGSRIGGGDALATSLDLPFEELGRLCKRIEAVHKQDDYKDDFDWIDFVRPVNDPSIRADLQDRLIDALRDESGGDLSLAPPELVDWDQVDHFHFHYDRPQGDARSPVRHRDLRLSDYLAGLRRVSRLEGVSIPFLKGAHIEARDGSESVVHKWPVWRCLTGEISFNGRSYVLDDGEFFAVSDDYIAALNAFVDALPASATELPALAPDTHEKDFNISAATQTGALLMDRQTVTVTGRTTAIEICDLLTADRELIHVKRKFGSSDLSHLFAQGAVAGELLQANDEFREAAAQKVAQVAGATRDFGFLEEDVFDARAYCVTFAVVGAWADRPASAALPFFSKVNLRKAVGDLRPRGFRVAFARVDVAM